VVSIRLSVARAVEAHQDVIVIVDPSEMEVKADLTGSQASKLSKGMLAVVRATTPRGEELQGVIRRVPYDSSAASQLQGDGSVRVALESAADGSIPFELGDILHVTVELERRENVLWLPPQALRRFEGRAFVVVQQDGVQRRADIKTGLEADDRVEIVEGLAEGQVVVGQ
jgi:hypothetical protein